MKLASHKTALAVLLGCLASSVLASESSDLSIQGTIRPAACNLSLSKSTFDYGTISASSLNTSTRTKIRSQPFDLLLTCDGPSRVAIVGTDNRAGTASETDDNNYGLGRVDGSTIGFYLLWLGALESIGDGESVDRIVSSDGGTTWSASDTLYLTHSPSKRISWAAPGTKTPKALTTIQQKFMLDTQIRPRDQLPAANDAIPLDGFATISLVYL